MPYIFNPGAIPHIEDKEGQKAYVKALHAECQKLGGKPKATWGRAKLREMYSQLKQKRDLDIAKFKQDLK